MDMKPTKNLDLQAQVVPDLPLTPDQVTDVKGGRIDAATPKLHEAACKGTHLPEVVIELW
jgi:hypothetical protein